ncbi:MAG: o-succinylbenzoate synthase [Bdellovibrio sp.]
MKLKNLGFKDFSRPFKVPQNICGQLQSSKTGSYLLFEDEKGHQFLGEIPILPGFLPLTLEEVKEELMPVLPKSIEVSDTPDWDQPLFGATLSVPNSIQAIFAIESALFNYFHKEMSVEVPRTVLVQSAKELGDLQSHQTIKVKINRLELNQECQWITDYVDRNPEVRIRLDANRSLTQAQLSEYWNRLEAVRFNIEFFEEPTSNFENCDDIPLARDESLTNEFLEDGNFIVLKPTLHFGLIESCRLLKKNPNRIVISSTYETEIGMAPLIYLASFGQLSPGLDTLSAFALQSNFQILKDSIRFDRTFC